MQICSTPQIGLLCCIITCLSCTWIMQWFAGKEKVSLSLFLCKHHQNTILSLDSRPTDHILSLCKRGHCHELHNVCLDNALGWQLKTLTKDKSPFLCCHREHHLSIIQIHRSYSELIKKSSAVHHRIALVSCDGWQSKNKPPFLSLLGENHPNIIYLCKLI